MTTGGLRGLLAGHTRPNFAAYPLVIKGSKRAFTAEAWHWLGSELLSAENCSGEKLPAMLSTDLSSRRSVVAAIAAVSLSACTVHVTPESILSTDEAHNELDIRALAAVVPEAKLEPVSLRHADGVATRGVHMLKPAPRALIVYLSGNKMTLAVRGPLLLPRFAMLNADLLWLDYRGEGASGGQPSPESLQLDLVDLLELASREHKPIVLHGLSMGSLLAGKVAADPRISALVLEGGITTISQVAEATFPGWLRVLVNVDVDPRLAAFNNLTALNSYTKPLLVLVGARDEETPPILSQRLYDTAKSQSKVLLVVPEKTHANAMTASSAIDAYRKLLASVGEPA